ncbi:hypothetical protein ACLKA6_000603 [Drosophila palustris]
MKRDPTDAPRNVPSGQDTSSQQISTNVISFVVDKVRSVIANGNSHHRLYHRSTIAVPSLLRSRFPSIVYHGERSSTIATPQAELIHQNQWLGKCTHHRSIDSNGTKPGLSVWQQGKVEQYAKSIGSHTIQVRRDDVSEDLDNLLRKFWELEQLGEESADLSNEDKWTIYREIRCTAANINPTAPRHGYWILVSVSIKTFVALGATF